VFYYRKFAKCIVKHKPIYLGSYPICYPKGFYGCCNTFPPSYYEDFMFYMFNQNHLISIITGFPTLYYDRLLRATNYFVTHTLGFMILTFLNEINASESYKNTLQVVILVPLTTFTHKLLKYTLVCSCCPGEMQENRMNYFTDDNRSLYLMYIAGLWMTGILLLIIAAIGTAASHLKVPFVYIPVIPEMYPKNMFFAS